MRRAKPVQLSQATVVFSKEIDDFCAQSGLSRRERDIMITMVGNVTHSEKMGTHLGITTHTVNNHLKSMFEKLTCQSKNELLGRFLEFAAKCHADRHFFMRQARVVFFDSQPGLAEQHAATLAARGVRTLTAASVAEVMELVNTGSVDAVVTDQKGLQVGGDGLLSRFRGHLGKAPRLILATNASDLSLADVMDWGISALLRTPVTPEQLFQVVMSVIVDDAARITKLLGLKASTLPALTVETDGSVRDVANLGWGGFFLPFTPRDPRRSRIEVDTIIEVNLKLPHVPNLIAIKGYCAWRRDSDNGVDQAGIGVAFLEMDEHQRCQIYEHLTARRVSSTIPKGPAVSALTAEGEASAGSERALKALG